MAETDKPCSPWDPISPRGFSGREVGKTSGFPVLVNLLPGTDTSWRNTQADLPHCFSEEQKTEYLRYIDKPVCVDEGLFNITIVMNRDDFVGWFRTETRVQWILRALAKSGFLADTQQSLLTSLRDALFGSEVLDLNAVHYLYGQTEMKNLDSVVLSTYTELSDGLKGKESFVLLGTKDIREAAGIVADYYTMAKQIIEQGIEVGDLMKALPSIKPEARVDARESSIWTSLLERGSEGMDCKASKALSLQTAFIESLLSRGLCLLRVSKPISSQVLSSDILQTFHKIKSTATCNISTELLVAFGYGISGYGIGEYGL
jgi:hypothetical protein